MNPTTSPAQATSSSLRRQLLAGIVLPVVVLLVVHAISLYNEALDSANTAYDRTLLASAKSIGEQLEVQGEGSAVSLVARVPYSALETFETDNQSRMFYRVSTREGVSVSGFDDLPTWTRPLPQRSAYAALVDFYDDEYRGQTVRMAALIQPVAGPLGQTLAVIQVAETLELRRQMAREILVDTLWRQALLLIVLVAVVYWVVQRATLGIRQLSRTLESRSEDDLTPIDAPNTPVEIQPLVDATNHLMQRLAHLLQTQQKWVRDVSHQIRTPLAVLKAQVQSARRGDLAAPEALAEIESSVDRTTRWANQMLALAKIEQIRHQAQSQHLNFTAIAREVALDLAPLVAEKNIDFQFEGPAAWVRAHDWMLRELVRNLLHNAIRHTPMQGHIGCQIALDAPHQHAILRITDTGPGLMGQDPAQLFVAFSPSSRAGNGGLGLAICFDIVQTLGGTFTLQDGVVTNSTPTPVTCAEVQLPLQINT